jgi:hypothetical protein
MAAHSLARYRTRRWLLLATAGILLALFVMPALFDLVNVGTP